MYCGCCVHVRKQTRKSLRSNSRSTADKSGEKERFKRKQSTTNKSGPSSIDEQRGLAGTAADTLSKQSRSDKSEQANTTVSRQVKPDRGGMGLLTRLSVCCVHWNVRKMGVHAGQIVRILYARRTVLVQLDVFAVLMSCHPLC